MKEKLLLQIPTPCHENWGEMDAVKSTTGRFCGSCQKTVVDFTAMSDDQVLNYFAKYQGNTCGRFDNEQLNRVIAPAPPPKKTWYKFAAAAMATGIMMGEKAKAQQLQGKVASTQVCTAPVTAHTIGDTLLQNKLAGLQLINNDTSKRNLNIRLGGVSTFQPTETPPLLEGVVRDETGKPIPFATVMIKGTKTGVASDTGGKFKIKCLIFNEKPTLLISSVGYETLEHKIDMVNDIKNIEMINDLKEANIHLILNPTALILMSRLELVTVGFTVISHPKKKKPKLTDTLRNVLPKWNNEAKAKLGIAPNPAKAGNNVTLSFEKAGEYQLQLLSLQGNVIQSEKLLVEADNGKANINIPNNLAAGEYFFSASNSVSKKIISGKFIVE